MNKIQTAFDLAAEAKKKAENAKYLIARSEIGALKQRVADLEGKLRDSEREIAALATDHRCIIMADKGHNRGTLWVAWTDGIDLRVEYSRQVFGDLDPKHESGGIVDYPEWHVDSIDAFDLVDHETDEVLDLKFHIRQQAEVRFKLCEDAIYEAAGAGHHLTDREVETERYRRCDGE